MSQALVILISTPHSMGYIIISELVPECPSEIPIFLQEHMYFSSYQVSWSGAVGIYIIYYTCMFIYSKEL